MKLRFYDAEMGYEEMACAGRAQRKCVCNEVLTEAREPGHSPVITRTGASRSSETMGMRTLLVKELTPRAAWRVLALQIGLIALLGALS